MATEQLGVGIRGGKVLEVGWVLHVASAVCERACLCAFLRACDDVRACMRACVRACTYGWIAHIHSSD